jgi:hypothetical protein
MKTKEEVEKEFDEKFNAKSLDEIKYNRDQITAIKEEWNRNLRQGVKSHISKIRKDDIDGLVEELKKRREETKKHLSERGSCLLCIEEDYCFHEIQRDTFSDIIDHLQAQKEKV